MKNLLLLFAISLSLGGCAVLEPGRSSAAPKSAIEAPGPATGTAGLNAQQTRITDGRLRSDMSYLEETQVRLRKLNEAGVPQSNYALAKAQCWLDSALTQYQENDRTGYIEEALTESVKIIQQLEIDKAAKAGQDTPLIARSSRLRQDLWSQLGQFKSASSGMVCNARTVACAEVRLVRAGHADEQTGWRSAIPHVRMVEDAVLLASAQASACLQPAVARVAPVAAPTARAIAAAPAAPTAPVATREVFVVLTDALFKFAKSGPGDILPGGVQRLKAVADRLKKYKTIESLAIVGHTDRIGSPGYNLKLSGQRADTVKAQLEQLGVRASSWSALGAGLSEPVTSGCTGKRATENLIQCLQADRRVTIEVTGSVR